MRLDGAVALVTGGSSGIGAAAARALATAGVRPLIAGRDTGRLQSVAAETGGLALAADLTAPVQLTRLLVPGMIARGRGHIVFVSSIAGATGVRGEAVYSAAKAGLGCFAESLADEISGRGVGVSVIVPGVIDTPFFERRGRPYDRRRPAPLPPERVARALVTAVERDQRVVFVPRWMRFPAWLHGALPGTYRRLAARFG